MKTIIVTKDNINEFHPYQGTNKKLSEDDILYVTDEKIPSVRREKVFFAIVTDFKINANTEFLISDKRAKAPEAKQYGWDMQAERIKERIGDKAQHSLYNRYSVNQKRIK